MSKLINENHKDENLQGNEISAKTQEEDRYKVSYENLLEQNEDLYRENQILHKAFEELKLYVDNLDPFKDMEYLLEDLNALDKKASNILEESDDFDEIFDGKASYDALEELKSLEKEIDELVAKENE